MAAFSASHARNGPGEDGRCAYHRAMPETFTDYEEMADGPAPHQVSVIAPYRWHIISNIATRLGWEWHQESNTVDRFTKDGVVATVSWTSRDLGQATGTNGLSIPHSDSAKLQKLCRALGADIRDDQRFTSLPAGNVAKLPSISALRAAAVSGLKVVADADNQPVYAGDVSSTPPAETAWTISLGEDYTRAEIQTMCSDGDHRYRGIVALPSDMVLYSDHKAASSSGYAFDGWNAGRELFYYTGEGGIGDQQFTGGNSAIRDHEAQGRALRLFVAVGNAEGSGARVHSYVGQFKVDANTPYVTKRAPGRDGVPRDVIVFRLRPVGHVVTEVAQISIVEGVVAASAIEQESVEAVPEPAVTAERTEVERTISGEAEQKEAGLTARFRDYLEKHGRDVKRYKITTPAGLLFTDTADVSSGVLYEAKGTAERMSVRLALGQVLDYGRYVRGADLAILLPDSPAADLVELLESHNVGCVVEGELGEFSDMTGLKRCPDPTRLSDLKLNS